jgi:hypothetical protein
MVSFMTEAGEEIPDKVLGFKSGLMELATKEIG